MSSKFKYTTKLESDLSSLNSEEELAVEITTHTKHYLEQTGLIGKLAASDIVVESDEPIQESRRIRIKRPKNEFDPSTARALYITELDGFHISEMISPYLHNKNIKDFILWTSRDISFEEMESIDKEGKDLYEYCKNVLISDNITRKYALANIIAQGISKTGNKKNFLTFLRSLPLSEKDHNEHLDDLSQNQDAKDVAEIFVKLKKDIFYEYSELNDFFKKSPYYEKIIVEIFNLINSEKGGNEYVYRLLMYIFSHASENLQENKSSKIDVIEYYQKARSLMQEKIDEGVIPKIFQDKLNNYHPKDLALESKMIALLQGRIDTVGYYRGDYSGLDSRYVLIDKYNRYVPKVFDEDNDQKKTNIFREPGTEYIKDKNSDYTMKIAIHELFHHLSGHSYYQESEAIHNNKVGLRMAIGRFMNEAVTERLASKVMPEADQAYSEERALLYALQINSNGLLTDEIIYEAYLEEREEEGLPKLKALLKTIGQAYQEKGFLQKIDKIYEEKGYHEAIAYLKKVTEKSGREFKSPT